MHQLARQFKADIDTKLSALTQLIQTADNARLQLQTAIDRAESLAHRVVELAGGMTVDPARPAPGVSRAEMPSPTLEREASSPSPPEVSRVA